MTKKNFYEFFRRSNMMGNYAKIDFCEHNSRLKAKIGKSLFFKIFDCKLFHWICLVETINLIPKFIKIGQ